MEFLKKELDYKTAGILIGIIIAVMAYPALFQGWAFAGALRKIDQWILAFLVPAYAAAQPFYSEPALGVALRHTRIVIFMLFFILGGFAAAWISKEFSVKSIPNKTIAAEAIVGGLLMGMGIVFITTCNVGTFLGAVTQMGVGAYISAIGIIIGAYLGMLYFKRKMGV